MTNKISRKPKAFISLSFATISLRRSRNITLVFSADLCYNGVSEKPPLCKGRCRANARRRDCKSQNETKNNPSVANATAPFTQGSLWTRSCIFRGMGFARRVCNTNAELVIKQNDKPVTVCQELFSKKPQIKKGATTKPKSAKFFSA